MFRIFLNHLMLFWFLFVFYVWSWLLDNWTAHSIFISCSSSVISFLVDYKEPVFPQLLNRRANFHAVCFPLARHASISLLDEPSTREKKYCSQSGTYDSYFICSWRGNESKWIRRIWQIWVLCVQTLRWTWREFLLSRGVHMLWLYNLVSVRQTTSSISSSSPNKLLAPKH